MTDLLGDDTTDKLPNGERVPRCPTQEIVDAFHKALPMLPQVAVLNGPRKQAIAARWRDVVTTDKLDREGGIKFFQWYFEHAAGSSFLTGRGAARQGDRAWKAGFDWLLRPANFAKVIEGNYHHQEIKA